MTRRRVYLDDLQQLITDSQGVADILGIGHSQSISTYRRRHPDFPAPVLDLGAGRCKLWLRTDIHAWREKHPARRTST